MEKLTLTKSQEECLIAVKTWWNEPFKEEDHAFSIIGAAGTGKSYLIKVILETIINRSCCITAPTHKALRVLETRCCRSGKTLQSLHGLRPNTDMETFDIKNPQFDPKGNPHMNKYSCVIIDESSMVNKSLYELNRERAIQYKCKILYVLDRYQLPPVNEKLSITASCKNKFELTEIVRQEQDNPLMDVFHKLRNDIDLNTNSYLAKFINNRKDIRDEAGYELMNVPDFTKNILEYYSSEEFRKNMDYFRTIAYTNLRVEHWNNTVRDYLIKDSRQRLITMDDVFTSNVTIVDAYNAPVLINSEDYTVDMVDTMISSENIKCYVVVFKAVYNNRSTPPFLILDHTHRDSLVLYSKICNEMFETAKRTRNGNMWKAYFDFRKRILTLTSITINGHEVRPDIYYGYAITSHKSQGSTYTNVAVDLGDITSPISRYGKRITTESIMAKHLAYVAMSRTRNKCLIQY